MRPLNLGSLVVSALLVLVPRGAGLAAAQADSELRLALENVRQRLGVLEEAIGPLRDLERELRDGSLVAVVRQDRVDYVDPAALRESLRRSVIQALVADWVSTGNYDSLGKITDEAYINSEAGPMEREAMEESNAFLQNLTHDRSWVESRIQLLREELENLERRLRQRPGEEAQQPPPGSAAPGGVQGRWSPASQRVCPSPLFGKLLWSGSTPRCMGEGFTLFPGWRFGEKTPLVCARCTSSCYFAETTGGRLICVVTGVPDQPAGTTPAGRTPAPGTPPPAPSPRPIYNLSGTWRPAQGGPDVSVMTGGTTRYAVSGSGANRVRNEGTLVGDGTILEGSFRDVPGYCCGRDGYVWLEVIDENSYRVRSVWWTPGQGSKEKPQLTFGWSTWVRR